MKEFLEIFNNKEISEIYQVIEEFEIWVGDQNIKIKISIDNYGRYHHRINYHYKGSQQASVYLSSICIGDSKKEAYMNAYREIFGFYNPEDKKAKWILNEDY